jgi:DNA ligase-1
LKKAISQCPDYDILFSVMLQYGPAGQPITYLAESCTIQPGTPVKPMLAKPTKGINEILQRFTNIEFTCEYKYDGMRAQIHKTPTGEISLFSRNSENLTGMYPDLVEIL